MDFVSIVSAFRGQAASIGTTQPSTPEMHVLLVCVTLLLAAAGRIASAIAFHRYAATTTSWLPQAALVVACLGAAVHVAAAGLLSASLALSVSAFLVVAPCGMSVRAVVACFLSTMLVTCVCVPHLLPLLLPSTSILDYIGGGEGGGGRVAALRAPFAGARLHVPPETAVLVQPVLIQYDSVRVTTLVAHAPVAMHDAAIVSTAKGSIIHHLNATLTGSTYVALLGEDAIVENCTLRCDEAPCLWVLSSAAPSMMFRDVVVVHNGKRLTIGAPSARSTDGGGGVAVGTVCDRSLEIASVVACVEKTDASASLFSQTLLETPGSEEPQRRDASRRSFPQHHLMTLLQDAPLPVLLVEQIPSIVRFCTNVGAFFIVRVVQPLWGGWEAALVWATPIAQTVREFLLKVATVVVCRAVTLHYVQRSVCEPALSAYAGDAQFRWILNVVHGAADLVAELDEVPVVSPTLAWSWRLECDAAAASWRAAFSMLRAASYALNTMWPVVRNSVALPLCAVIQVVLGTLIQLFASSLRATYGLLDDTAWSINTYLIGMLVRLVHPLLAAASFVLVLGWRLLYLYLGTSLSTHLFVALCQSGLLFLVLSRDFRSRVQKRRQHQNFLMRTISSVPLAVMGMLRHYSKPVSIYLVLHLVGIVLVLGTSVIPMGGKLYLMALHVALPGASTYGWVLFFRDPQDEMFWWHVVSRSCAKAIACTLIQKTIGEFVFAIVSEVLIGLGIAAAGFCTVVWIGRRSRGSGTVSPTDSGTPTTHADEGPDGATSGSPREIH